MTDFLAALQQYKQLVLTQPDMPMSRLLPLLFRLRGKPLSLDWSHYFFEPMFRLKDQPRIITMKCGRQVGKSQSLSAAQILHSFLIPYYSMLTVLPRFEQARIFSQTVVGPLLRESPFKSILSPRGGTDSVLQRDIGKGSHLFYGYSYGGADRLRGRAITGGILYDEVQSMDTEDIDVIDQCMASSAFKFKRMTGTPLTFDNVLEKYWDRSSQAEWCVQCLATGCKKYNVCNTGGDLLQMIGDNTLICAHCGAPISTRHGHWQHMVPDRQRLYAGYHIPQVILPMHYESPAAWKVIKDSMRWMPKYKLYNEIFGESFDSGAKLLTQGEILKSCIAPYMPPESFERGRYTMVAVGVDWGGRGREKTSDLEDFISNTVVSVCGLTPEGRVEVTYLYKVPYSMNHQEECRAVVEIAGAVGADWLAMDYGGQGNVLEEMVVAAGWPRERLCPFTYTVMSNSKPIVLYAPPQANGVRSSYSLDKPRSIFLCVELIKIQMLTFADHDEYKNDHLTDYQAIYEESMENPRGSATRLIKRISRRTDDTVHSINFGTMALYHAAGMWPELANAFVTRDA